MKKRTTKTTDPLDDEVDFARFGPARRNAFAGAGERGGPSLLALWVVRSVRLPASIWSEVEEKARSKHLNLHQAMRAALVGWLRRTG